MAFSSFSQSAAPCTVVNRQTETNLGLQITKPREENTSATLLKEMANPYLFCCSYSPAYWILREVHPKSHLAAEQ
jgi:hypothetical protein